MKHIRFKRLCLFACHDPWNWASISSEVDYQNWVASVSIFGGAVGFEYAHKGRSIVRKMPSFYHYISK